MLGAILGPLISGGMNLLGGLMAKQPNYKKIANETFKGEFNARMGAAQKYGISKLVMAGAPAPAAPSAQAFNPIGEGLAAMGQDISRAVQNFSSPFERQIAAETLKKARSENELVQAQTRSINVRTAQQIAPPPPQIPTEVQPPVRTTGVNILGQGFPFDPGTSDSAVIENRHGDLVQELYGLGVLGADLYHNREKIYGMMRDMGSTYWPTIQPYVAPWGIDYKDLSPEWRRGNYVPLDRSYPHRKLYPRTGGYF